MISLAVLMSLLAAAEAEPPVMSITEARPAERLSASFEARCDGRVLSLQGAGVRRPSSEAPALTLDGKTVALPTAALEFLSADRSAYRFSAACGPDRSFHVRLNRVSGAADGTLAFAAHAFDVNGEGRLTDRGGQKSTAESFSYR